MTADEIMRRAHGAIRDDYPKGIVYAHGAADALRLAGLLTDNEHRLWGLALERCPGHDDEGGRDFCAYGCELPKSEEGNHAKT